MRTAEARGRFLEILHSEGVPEPAARQVLRLATTLTRLAVAQCNGDWPCDNGEREIAFCIDCQSGMVPSKMVRGICEDCRTTTRLTTLLDGFGIAAIMQGDPRGCVVRLRLPSGRADDGDGNLCVPS